MLHLISTNKAQALHLALETIHSSDDIIIFGDLFDHPASLRSFYNKLQHKMDNSKTIYLLFTDENMPITAHKTPNTLRTINFDDFVSLSEKNTSIITWQ